MILYIDVGVLAHIIASTPLAMDQKNLFHQNSPAAVPALKKAITEITGLETRRSAKISGDTKMFLTTSVSPTLIDIGS